jgi:AmpE protein
MSLIAIVLTMATENFWRSGQGLQPFKAVIDGVCWLQGRWGSESWFNGPGGVLAGVLPGVLVIGLLQFAFGAADGFLGWLLSLILAVAVLIAAIGRRGADQEVDDYQRALERGDVEGAYLHVRELLRGRTPTGPADMNRLLIERLLVRNNERLLAILFWFAALGPVGAVLYRSASQLKGLVGTGRAFGEDFMEAALRLQAILDWIPARITALLYALIGSFIDALRQWRLAGSQWGIDLYTSNQGALINSGIGSLRLHDQVVIEAEFKVLRREVAEAQALITRTVIAWITGFALLTIAGWLS